MAKKTERKISKLKHDKALRAATMLLDEVIDRYPITRYLHDQLTELLGDKHISKIATLIDPEAAKLEDLSAWIAQEKAIEAKLDDEGKELLRNFDNEWCNRDYFRSVASFYLGFVAGRQLQVK